MTVRISSARRFNEWWIPAFAGMTKGCAKVSLRRNDGGLPKGLLRENADPERMADT